MTVNRRTALALVLSAGACLIAGPFLVRLWAQPLSTDAGVDPGAGQEQAPNRRDITVTASDFTFSPARIEVAQDDLVKLTVTSSDIAYGLTIDEYRLSKRVPAGGATTVEFRADRSGTFAFYSNLTSDARHAQMRGELIVRAR